MSVADADVIVVGAGISGLACAHALAAAREVRVLEASTQAGGLVRTVEEAGFQREEGPEALPPNADAVRALCLELALPVHEVPASATRRYVRRGEHLLEVPSSPPALLTSPLFSPLGKLRLLGEPLRARGRALDGSIADFTRHRLGREFLERLVDPMIGGIHAGRPEELSLRACFPEAVELLERHGSVLGVLRARARERVPGAPRPTLWKPAGGMQALPRALAAALGTRLELANPVRAVTREGALFRVEREHGPALTAQRLVLATAAAPARALLARIAPEAGRALGDLAAESLASVAIGVRRADVAHALDGFGYLVPSSFGSPVLGTLFSSTLWPGAASGDCVLLRSLLGGARHPGYLARSDEELAALAVDEARARLGLTGDPRLLRVARWPEVIPRFDLAHPARQSALQRGLVSGLDLLGNYTRGIGLACLVREARALAARLVDGA